MLRNGHEQPCWDLLLPQPWVIAFFQLVGCPGGGLVPGTVLGCDPHPLSTGVVLSQLQPAAPFGDGDSGEPGEDRCPGCHHREAQQGTEGQARGEPVPEVGQHSGQGRAKLGQALI